MSQRKLLGSACIVAAVLVAALAGPAMIGVSGDAAAAATTAGCGKTPALTSGTRTIQSSGQNRSYILRIPDGYTSSRSYRLIFGFHWLNGSAAAVSSAGYYGLQPLSNNSTIFVAPQGIDNGWANTNGQDLTLVDDLTRQIESDLCVDTAQLLRPRLELRRGHELRRRLRPASVFRAVAVLSGANLSGCNGGTQPVAYFGIHGTHDSVLNITNGRSLRDTFVRNNGCTAQNPQRARAGTARRISPPPTRDAGPGTRSSGPRSTATTPPARSTGPHPNDARTWTSGEIWRFFSPVPDHHADHTPPTTTPPTTNPTTTPPTTTPPTTTGQPGACTATYRAINSWPGGFQGEVIVANNGSNTINGWTVA